MLSDTMIRKLCEKFGPRGKRINFNIYGYEHRYLLKKPMIEEFVEKQTVNDGLPSHGLSSHRYDARLGNEFIVYSRSEAEDVLGQQKADIFALDLRRKDMIERVTKKYVVDTSQSDNSFKLLPGAFVLAHTVERFNIPRFLSFEVKDKSTLARLGIFVQNTIGECGWGNSSTLTLEITNNNIFPVYLYPGMGICQLVFHMVDGYVETSYEDRQGKYQNQSGVVLPR